MTQDRQLISYTDWFERSFKVQAALDLYLVSMRKVEDATRDFPGGHLSSYPPLRFVASPMMASSHAISNTPGSDATPKLILTQYDLLQHLTRRGSLTHRFDQPLLFARVGIDLNGTSGRASLESLQPQRTFDPSAPTMATVASVLDGMRWVLSSLPQLENLALTGILHRAVVDKDCAARSQLRRYSMGPRPDGASMQFSGMEDFEESRVCGSVLREEELRRIEELCSLERLL